MENIENTKGNAFIGISLGNKLFTRSFLQRSLYFLLKKHDTILLLIADDLLKYTRITINNNGSAILDIRGVSSNISVRYEEFHRFIQSIIERIESKYRHRILVKRWAYFADAEYVNIGRCLQIAYASINEFKVLVNNAARQHIDKSEAIKSIPGILELCAQYLIDEVAMNLRITEIEKYSFEYYPGEEIDVIKKLYNNDFEKFGLSIKNITNKSNLKRTFNMLDL